MPAAVALVAGSGIDLRPLLTRVTREISFDETNLPGAGVQGHRGMFVLGYADDMPVVLQCGRLHVYEGHSIETVGATVDVLSDLGARTVVFTNAAGGLMEGMAPGSLMAVDRVLTWPCRAWPDRPASLSVDLTLPGCEYEGAYIWVHGPSYETRAEINALCRLGAGAVGMSTAPEVFRARQLGLRVGAVSCITNSCLLPQALSHEHVLDTAGRASGALVDLLRQALPQLHGSQKT